MVVLRGGTAGPAHERTLESLANVATVQMRLGKHVEAGALFSEVRKRSLSSLSCDHLPRQARDQRKRNSQVGVLCHTGS
eukprot:COSAG06_NODE_61124_length_268_cov_1.686391_1_plen_78_part_01